MVGPSEAIFPSGLIGGSVTPLIAQAVGVLAAFAWAFPVSLGIFLAIKYTVGLRVSEQEEMEGLDITEHGILGYPPTQITEGLPGSPVTHGGGYSPAPSPNRRADSR